MGKRKDGWKSVSLFYYMADKKSPATGRNQTLNLWILGCVLYHFATTSTPQTPKDSISYT